MSTSVEICTHKPIRLDPDEDFDIKYYYGVRDGYGIVQRGEMDNRMVFFDCERMGRGVEVTLMAKNKIEIRLNTPTSTSDLELFLHLIQMIIQKFKADEVIYEGEVYSSDALDRVQEVAEANMASGIDLLLHPPTQENIEIIAIQGPIAIDKEEREQFIGGQEDFDHYLNKKQAMPGTHEIAVPVVAETDKGALWCLFFKTGRYVIIPRYARPRNRDMRVDKYLIFYAGEQHKAIDYRDFLKEIDLTRRYDAERSIVKLTKAQVKAIFDKYSNALED